MNRRHYLATTAAALGVAGCSESEDIEGGSREATDTPTPLDDAAGGDGDIDEATETPTDEDTDTPAGEANLALASHDLYVEEGDYHTEVYVEAIVENAGDAPSGNIELQADWYDEDGNYLDNDAAYLATLQGGATWEGRVYYLGSDAEEVADYEVGGEFYERSGAFDPPHLELLESELSVRAEDREAEVQGRVENTSDDDEDYVAAIATIVDDEGVVLGDNYSNVTDFRAGETWRFSVTWRGRDRTGRAASHDVHLTDSV